MQKSTFTTDLEREKKLASFLDTLYTKHLKHYSFKRETYLKRQYKGIDLILTHIKTYKNYYVDEKSQLDYLNEDLPTFAFELYYFKEGKHKQGWLFSKAKKTQFYALVTGIYSDSPEVFTSARITFVNRDLLLKFLQDNGIHQNNITIPQNHGRLEIPQLDPEEEGYLFYSKKNKAERPLNLILRLDFLIKIGVAKRLA